MIVLDANVLIAHFEKEDPWHAIARQLLDDLTDEAIAASPITLAEVLVGPGRIGRIDVATALLADLGVASVAFPDDTASRLALLRVATELRLPDCCVLLAAEQVGAAVATFDTRLATAARRQGFDVRTS